MLEMKLNSGQEMCLYTKQKNGNVLPGDKENQSTLGIGKSYSWKQWHLVPNSKATFLLRPLDTEAVSCYNLETVNLLKVNKSDLSSLKK